MVSEYEKLKAHKVRILWSLLILAIIPYEKISMLTQITIFLAQFIIVSPLAI